ncbi:50S ribosomal protein L23 [Patescibacteria group bacterium]|nr:50S ribosomal protein L23 [Patescibacteria group bacterium]
MALFSFKKEKKPENTEVKEKSVTTSARIHEKKEVTPDNTVPKKKLSSEQSDLSFVLRRPRITEKATSQAQNGVYVFEVATTATKKIIADAVLHFYKVKPLKIRVTPIPKKIVPSRIKGRFGVRGAGKKAYVYLRKGDSIEIV